MPNDYHFIYGLADDSRHKPFLMLHYLAVLTCHAVNTPRIIYFHYKHEPTGYWWQRAKAFLTLDKIEPPTEIFGRSLLRVEHVADILRLQILQAHGGIYLDIDVLSLQPLSLTRFDCVLGYELGGGLCNAVILAKPGTRFINRWLGEYRSFDPYKWNQHSVQVPRNLATEIPAHVHLVDHDQFFWPIKQHPFCKLVSLDLAS